jgi:outer membrane protein assembly factor BamB
VTGSTNEAAGCCNYATAAYDTSSGATIWSREYDGPASNHDDARAIAISPDGSTVFVTGESFSTVTSYDFATIAYDATTGATRWTKRWDVFGGSLDTANALIVTPDGTAMVATGSAFNDLANNPSNDWATIAYDAATGSRLWSRRYAGLPGGNDEAYAVTAASDGSQVFVTGVSDGKSDRPDCLTIAYDAATGQALWVRRFDGPSNGVDAGISIAATADAVVVGGVMTTSAFSSDFLTMAYEPHTGVRLWMEHYNGNADSEDSAMAVAVSSTLVFTTGTSTPRSGIGTISGKDYLTVAYDITSGTTRWTRRYNGPAERADRPWAVSVAPDGQQVFVTGESFGKTSLDVTTIAYRSSDGGNLWRRRYDGPVGRHDAGMGVAVDPNGSFLVVSGWSTGVVGRELTTVAYDL